MSEEIKDLSKPRTRVAFRIDEDIFEGPPVIPGETMVRHVGALEALSQDNPLDAHISAIWKTLESILRPASYERLYARYSSAQPDPDEPDYVPPVDLEQVRGAMDYLMEAYGMRPPKQSSSS
jgi:hypothetical protein